MKERVNVSDLKSAGFGAAGAKLKQKRLQARAALLDLSGPVRARVLLSLREMIKNSVVSDPDMCACVKRPLENSVDLLWDDLTVYVETCVADAKDKALGRLDYNLARFSEFGVKPTCCSPRWWRASTLYHFVPFDISVFGQLKDPFYWVLFLLSLCSAYGVRVIFSACILLMHFMESPPDEYQLVGFILTFKGSQFLSSGVGLGIAAAVQFYMCVNLDGTHTCADNGPGAKTNLVGSGIDFFGSCVLVWIAFFCLPCSARNAGIRDIALSNEGGEEPEEGTGFQKCCCCCWRCNKDRGGRLGQLLFYDFLSFLASCSFLVVLIYTDIAHLRPGGKRESFKPSHAELEHEWASWHFRVAFFFTRMIYAFFALPFLPMYLPGLSTILTHTIPTGYNRNGACVPFILHPMPEDGPAGDEP